MIDKHSYEQVHLKVEPKSFLYEFLNSGGSTVFEPPVEYRPLSRSGHDNTRTRPSPDERLKDGFQRDRDACFG